MAALNEAVGAASLTPGFSARLPPHEEPRPRFDMPAGPPDTSHIRKPSARDFLHLSGAAAARYLQPSGPTAAAPPPYQSAPGPSVVAKAPPVSSYPALTAPLPDLDRVENLDEIFRLRQKIKALEHENQAIVEASRERVMQVPPTETDSDAVSLRALANIVSTLATRVENLTELVQIPRAQPPGTDTGAPAMTSSAHSPHREHGTASPGQSPGSFWPGPSLLPSPPHTFVADDLELDPAGFKATSPAHFLGPMAHLYYDFTANARTSADTASDRTSYGNRIAALMGHHRIDVAPALELNRLTPLGTAHYDSRTDLNLGEGVSIRSSDRTASIPPQAQWVKYASMCVSALVQRLSHPTGPFVLAHPWGPYRQWQTKFVIVVFQLLFRLDHHLTVELGDPLSWEEAWCYKCAVVSRFFYGQTLVEHGMPGSLLKVVALSSQAQLSTPGAPHDMLAHVCREAISVDLLQHAKSTAIACAQLKLKAQKQLPAAALLDIPTGGGGGGGGGGGADAGGRAPANLCGVTGCSYAFATQFKCTHDFTVVCKNRFATTQGGPTSPCGLPHARAGPRAWTCRQAHTIQGLVTASELATLLRTSSAAKYVAGGGQHAASVKVQ
jgi:hypothetical protein